MQLKFFIPPVRPRVGSVVGFVDSGRRGSVFLTEERGGNVILVSHRIQETRHRGEKICLLLNVLL